MGGFFNTEQLKKQVKVLIFGSYHSNFLPILEEIKSNLNENGIQNVFFIKDLALIDETLTYEQKMGQIFERIEDLIIASDFNIFVLFEEMECKSVNSSVLIELTTLLQSDYFHLKSKRTIVVMPKNLNISMLTGIITSRRVNIFKYFDVFEISEYLCNYILNNL